MDAFKSVLEIEIEVMEEEIKNSRNAERIKYCMGRCDMATEILKGVISC